MIEEKPKIKAKRLKALIRYARQSPDEISDLAYTLIKYPVKFVSNYHKLEMDEKRFLGILFVILGKRTIDKILPYMYDDEVEVIQRAIQGLGDIENREINFVATEAMKLIKHRKYKMRGGEKKAIELLKKEEKEND